MRCLLLICLAALSFKLPAAAQLQLSEFFVDLHEDAKFDEIFASNSGSETLYLRISAEEVINPGLDNETSNKIANPRDLGLLVSPQRMVLNPGEEKRIRIAALERTSADRFFKVTVTPVVGEIESEEMIGVKLMIAYAAWVFVRPKNGEPQLSARREGHEIVVTNTGTTHAELTGGEQCSISGCVKIDRFRVLAGREKRIALPIPTNLNPIKFNVLYAQKNLKISL